MEHELRAITTNLKTMELSESTASKQKQTYQATLEKLTKQLAEAEKRTALAESEALKRQEELARLEAELDAEKTLNASLREDMEDIAAELQSI